MLARTSIAQTRPPLPSGRATPCLSAAKRVPRAGVLRWRTLPCSCARALYPLRH
ncbi:MC152.1L [Molluscum contagiosum virus subtype 1]|uniref:MC152.1L n=1 Tax=Molluscum contagiosum virus subtype 1 TaxID=10280 RepID=A0A7G5AXF4_MCV1|nr:MC152.1L [Molluscum contagiosum virus subtype 1]